MKVTQLLCRIFETIANGILETNFSDLLYPREKIVLFIEIIWSPNVDSTYNFNVLPLLNGLAGWTV